MTAKPPRPASRPPTARPGLEPVGPSTSRQRAVPAPQRAHPGEGRSHRCVPVPKGAPPGTRRETSQNAYPFCKASQKPPKR